MADVGSANIQITADDGPARSKLSSFFGYLKGAGKIATGVVGGLTLFGGLSSGMKAVWDNTIGANASMESYKNTLTVVMGNSQKALETLNWAKRFAAQTPFAMPDVVDATVKLQSYGLTAKDTLKDIGDMASVMNKPLDQAVEAVADAQTGELERLTFSLAA